MSDIINASNHIKLRLTGLKEATSAATSIYSSQTDYRPNFVLIQSKGGSQNFISDFLPAYGEYDELVRVIVTSWESLTNLVLQSSAVITCCVSFVLEIINNATYQTYLFAATVYEFAHQLPEHYVDIKSNIEDFFNIIQRSETRDLWWLNIKYDISDWINTFLQSVISIIQVSQKFYLAFVVVVCIGLLNTISLPSEASSSFLMNFIDNKTIASESQVLGASEESINLTISNIYKQPSIVKKIVNYTIQDNDTLASIASQYAVSPSTIIYNNNLTPDADIQTVESIFIPWVDGYIYNVTVDNGQTPEDIATFYNIPVELVTKENQDILIDGAFPKDSLVLISVPAPETDLVAIITKNEQEKERLQTLEKLQQERSKQISRAAVVSTNNKTFAGQRSSARAEGFIWPAAGTISRCVQSGHVACDIANRAAVPPPIYAVQEGVVVLVSHGAVAGYGNMVKVDHGNGIQTLYAHMTETYVFEGQRVSQGDALGQMGCTGWCTGTHLHFEVIVRGVQQNPLLYLP